MADTRRFVVLGLGSFGTALATKLCQNGCRVTGVDSDPERVDDLKHLLYEAVIADVTESDSLKELSLQNSHAVFISLGENITPSLLCALHARELGAKRIIVKGITQDHAKLLKSLGVERVIFPEIEIAMELADRMTWPNVVDFMKIDPEYSFAEITTPTSLSGATLREANLRKSFGISVVGVKDALSGKLHMFPDGEFRLTDDQLLVVVGRQTDLNRLRELD
ncbi:MAG: potassium channel family protein [Planctomycetota bacterium]|jgi:trk system potassium uptake protein TrkA